MEKVGRVTLCAGSMPQYTFKMSWPASLQVLTLVLTLLLEPPAFVKVLKYSPCEQHLAVNVAGSRQGEGELSKQHDSTFGHSRSINCGADGGG